MKDNYENKENINAIFFEKMLENQLNNMEKHNCKTCGKEGGGSGFIDKLGSFFRFTEPKFWVLFSTSLFFLLFLPTFIKLIIFKKKYSDKNWDESYFSVDKIDTGFKNNSLRYLKKGYNTLNNLVLTPEDVCLTLLNIILFALVSYFLFVKYLSKDVTRIMDNNLELYLNYAKSRPELKKVFLSVIDRHLKKNKNNVKNYDNWKEDCNNVYLWRTKKYMIIIGALLLIFFIITKFGLKHYNFKSNWTFILSAFFIMCVFTSEFYMLNFVFTKVIVFGETELLHKGVNVVNKSVNKL